MSGFLLFLLALCLVVTAGRLEEYFDSRRR